MLVRRRRSADGHEVVINSSPEPLYACLWTASMVFARAALLRADTRCIGYALVGRRRGPADGLETGEAQRSIGAALAP